MSNFDKTVSNDVEMEQAIETEKAETPKKKSTRGRKKSTKSTKKEEKIEVSMEEPVIDHFLDLDDDDDEDLETSDDDAEDEKVEKWLRYKVDNYSEAALHYITRGYELLMNDPFFEFDKIEMDAHKYKQWRKDEGYLNVKHISAIVKSYLKEYISECIMRDFLGITKNDRYYFGKIKMTWIDLFFLNIYIAALLDSKYESATRFLYRQLELFHDSADGADTIEDISVW